MRHHILHTSLMISSFYTPRAVLWNIRTLGFGWWVSCQLINARLVLTGATRMRRRYNPIV
ncbi:MAG: hypothetical protein WDN31_05670 [Hyphomicrobium sp.]